MTVCNCT